MTPISNSGASSMLMQQMQQSRQNMFKDADTDSNGSLSVEEFSAAGPKDANGNSIAPPSGAPSVEEMFSSLDTDGDGSLTQNEMDAGHRKQENNILSEDMLSELFSQLKNDAASFFDDADQDGDGNLTFDELETALATVENETPETAPPPPPNGGPSGPPPSDEASSTQQIFDDLDTNQDGTVSLEERFAVSEEDETEELHEEYSENLLQSEFTKSLLTLQEQQAA